MLKKKCGLTCVFKKDNSVLIFSCSIFSFVCSANNHFSITVAQIPIVNTNKKTKNEPGKYLKVPLLGFRFNSLDSFLEKVVSADILLAFCLKPCLISACIVSALVPLIANVISLGK